MYRVYPHRQEIYKRSPEQPDNVQGIASEILRGRDVHHRLQWQWPQQQRPRFLLPVRQEWRRK